MKTILAAFLMLIATLVPTTRAATLIGAVNPPTTLALVGIAVDPATGNLIVYERRGGGKLHVLDQTGTELGTIASPGSNSDDYDLDYSLGPMTIAGTAVPADTLLVFNGDDDPEKLYALDEDGAILAEVGWRALRWSAERTFPVPIRWPPSISPASISSAS